MDDPSCSLASCSPPHVTRTQGSFCSNVVCQFFLPRLRGLWPAWPWSCATRFSPASWQRAPCKRARSSLPNVACELLGRDILVCGVFIQLHVTLYNVDSSMRLVHRSVPVAYIAFVCATYATELIAMIAQAKGEGRFKSVGDCFLFWRSPLRGISFAEVGAHSGRYVPQDPELRGAPESDRTVVYDNIVALTRAVHGTSMSHLNRPGPPWTSTCTKHQHRGPILRPNGGERKIFRLLIVPRTYDHVPSHGGGTKRGCQIETGNPGFGWSGQPRAAVVLPQPWSALGTRSQPWSALDAWSALGTWSSLVWCRKSFSVAAQCASCC